MDNKNVIPQLFFDHLIANIPQLKRTELSKCQTPLQGLYAESHGIISNTIYDTENGKKFRMGKDSSFDPYWWGGEPVWDSIKFTNQIHMASCSLLDMGYS